MGTASRGGKQRVEAKVEQLAVSSRRFTASEIVDKFEKFEPHLLVLDWKGLDLRCQDWGSNLAGGSTGGKRGQVRRQK